MKNLRTKIQIATCVCLLVSARMHTAAELTKFQINDSGEITNVFTLPIDVRNNPDLMSRIPRETLRAFQEDIISIKSNLLVPLSSRIAMRNLVHSSALIKAEIQRRESSPTRSGGGLAPQVEVPKKESKSWCTVQ